MNDFNAQELDVIGALVEDAYPLLDIMKRRTGASTEQARAIYSSVALKASKQLAELRKAEAEVSAPKLVEG